MTDPNVDCGHCITPLDRCSDISDRNCMKGSNMASKPAHDAISGYSLVAYTEKWAGGDGMYRHGVGILVNHDLDSFDPYVVWTLITDGEKWWAESGDYCNVLDAAIWNYKRRGGKVGVRERTAT